MHTFEIKVQNALKSINQVLSSHRNPLFAADVQHSYDDKFTLAQSLIATALSSHQQFLLELGLSNEMIESLILQSDKTIILRFLSKEKCQFLREGSREIEAPDKLVEEGNFYSLTKKIVTTVKEYYWSFQLTTSLYACVKGGGIEECKLIKDHIKEQILMTSSSQSPRSEFYEIQPIDLDATWFFENWKSGSQLSSFGINRTSPHCFTPTRNPNSLSALRYFDDALLWSEFIEVYFLDSLYPLERLWQGHGQSFETAVSSISERILIPVVPLMSDDGKESDRFLTPSELNQCLAEEVRTLTAAKQAVRVYLVEKKNTTLSVGHVEMLVLIQHMREVSRYLLSGIMSIETMLERQLAAAIGREVTVEDVSDYMKLRGMQLFLPNYRPVPMNYVIRRSCTHSPEGTISLERLNVGVGKSSLMETIVHREFVSLTEKAKEGNQSQELILQSLSVAPPMSFQLNDAATKVTMLGDRYVHSYLHHQFGHHGTPPSLNLAIRARQFSSFIVVLGTITSSSSFDPIHAFIVQNKDEIKIPLDIEFIPSIKEFRRAVSSLSPEQKEFAEAIRELQLSNTLFAVAVIQIKPQLEKVLNLPPESLTKEIALSEDLLKLFIEYQIPSDLLSYDPADDALENSSSVSISSTSIALEKVKHHVKAIQDMINQAKKEELQEKKQQDDFHNRRAPTEMAKSARVRGVGSVNSINEASYIHKEESGIFASQISFTSAIPRSEPDFKQEEIPEKLNLELNQPSISTDLSSLPTILQNQFDHSGSGSSVRPGIIRPGYDWKRTRQDNLFTPARERNLGVEEQRTEKQRAFDLLDGLTRSGALSLDHASLHVIVASAHFFDSTLLETVIQKNLNPLIKLEQSTLIMASVIHGVDISELIEETEKDRVRSHSPNLLNKV